MRKDNIRLPKALEEEDWLVEKIEISFGEQVSIEEIDIHYHGVDEDEQ